MPPFGISEVYESWGIVSTTLRIANDLVRLPMRLIDKPEMPVM